MNPSVTPSTITQLYVAASVSMLVVLHALDPPFLLGVICTRMAMMVLNLTGFNREASKEMHEYLYENVEDHTGAGHPRLLSTRDELISPQILRMPRYCSAIVAQRTMFVGLYCFTSLYRVFVVIHMAYPRKTIHECCSTR